MNTELLAALQQAEDALNRLGSDNATIAQSLIDAGIDVGSPTDPFCASPIFRYMDRFIGQWLETDFDATASTILLRFVSGKWEPSQALARFTKAWYDGTLYKTVPLELCAIAGIYVPVHSDGRLPI